MPELPPDASMAERLAAAPPGQRQKLLDWLFRGPDLRIEEQWRFWARRSQLPPEDEDWRTWLLMAGRGFGKTRAGAEWVRELAEEEGEIRIALVAATMAEARSVMIEGQSGLLGIAPDDMRPEYEPSLRRLTWPTGAQAFLYSASEPEALRGAEHHFAWADEIAKWPHGRQCWDNLAMGLRLGDRPRTVATTTPRPVPLLRSLIGAAGVTVTRGGTDHNRAHLPPAFLDAMRDQYAGTRLGRQELDGDLIEEVEGALWSRALIEDRRVRSAPGVRRVVIGVDPPAGAGEGSDACGIVAVALGDDGAAYVIEDASVQGLSPEGWARAVGEAAARNRADRIVAEANNGGAMVASVLRAADAVLPLRLVHAAHGKAARAEPVAALYEAGRAFHVGAFPALEDEMAGLQAGGDYAGPGRSPDRADALVWAMTELMLGRRGEPGIRRV